MTEPSLDSILTNFPAQQFAAKDSGFSILGFLYLRFSPLIRLPGNQAGEQAGAP